MLVRRNVFFSALIMFSSACYINRATTYKIPSYFDALALYFLVNSITILSKKAMSLSLDTNYAFQFLDENISFLGSLKFATFLVASKFIF